MVAMYGSLRAFTLRATENLGLRMAAICGLEYWPAGKGAPGPEKMSFGPRSIMPTPTESADAAATTMFKI